MPNPPSRLRELLNSLAEITDRSERMEWLIDYSERFQEVPPDVAKRPFPESHRVPGCESEAFVWSKTDDQGNPRFFFAVENPQGVSARAFAKMLDETVSGAKTEEILAIEREIVYEIFGRGLALGKGQGLMGILFMVQALAKNSANRQDSIVPQAKKPQ